MNQHLASLDGLRGLAVLFVVFSHISNEGLYLHSALNFSGSGKYGVFLFFVLSAFLLSGQFFQKPAEQLYNRQIWLNYAFRRILRIFPLYTLALVGTTALNNFFHTDFSWLDVGRHLILQDGKGIYWTIPVEFKYYMLLPVAVFFLHRFLRTHIWQGISCIFMIMTVAAWQWPSPQSEMNDIRLSPYLVIFLSGTLTALLHIRLQTIEIRGRRWLLAMEITAFIAFAAILFTVPHWWNTLTGNTIEHSHFHSSYLLYGMLWSIFILAHLHGHGFFRWFLSLKPMRMIGTVSFSIYLLHLPVILLIKKYMPGPDIGKIVIILLLTFLFSLVSYRLVERPFSRLALFTGISDKSRGISNKSTGISDKKKDKDINCFSHKIITGKNPFLITNPCR